MRNGDRCESRIAAHTHGHRELRIGHVFDESDGPSGRFGKLASRTNDHESLALNGMS